MPTATPEWLPSPRVRSAMTKRMRAVAPDITSAAVADLQNDYPWIAQLGPEYRSWLNVLVHNGVESFIDWFESGATSDASANIFDAAPRPLQRHITLHQTVELIRTVIATTEAQLTGLLPRSDRATASTAITTYSREVAFAAAEAYASAAESRGAWDARIEAMVMDAVIRGEADDAVLARASALGWQHTNGLVVAVSDLEGAHETALRRAASKLEVDLLAAPQGERLVIVLGADFDTDGDALELVTTLSEHLGPGPVVVGQVVSDLSSAMGSARSALSGRRAIAAWPDAPRPVLASDLLPERALTGDGHARRQLARSVYGALHNHGGELIETLEAYLNHGTIEATARALFIHANTVRYRLGRVEDITGYSPTNARDTYALRLGLTLGRILG